MKNSATIPGHNDDRFQLRSNNTPAGETLETFPTREAADAALLAYQQSSNQDPKQFPHLAAAIVDVGVRAAPTEADVNIEAGKTAAQKEADKAAQKSVRPTA